MAAGMSRRRLLHRHETFFVNRSGVANATVAKAHGKGTIVKDDF